MHIELKDAKSDQLQRLAFLNLVDSKALVQSLDKYASMVLLLRLSVEVAMGNPENVRVWRGLDQQ